MILLANSSKHGSTEGIARKAPDGDFREWDVIGARADESGLAIDNPPGR